MEMSATKLWEELHVGEIENDNRSRAGAAMIKRYQGPSALVLDERSLIDDYSVGKLDRTNDPENFIYEYTTYVVPQMVYATPQARVTAPMIPSEDERIFDTKMIQAALNQWARSTNILGFMDQSALDPLFGFAACHVTPQRSDLGYRGSLARKEWPQVRRISDRNLWRDPAALSQEECRWWANRTVMDRDDLIDLAEKGGRDEGWDIEAIKRLGDHDLTSHYYTPEQRKLNLERRDVELVQMWWPKVETGEPEDGELGTIYTLVLLRSEPQAKGGSGGVSATFARDPQPFIGTEIGPFPTCGVHRIKDSPYTLAPLVAVDRQIREHNAQVRAALRRARKRKRLVVTNSDDPTFRRLIESAEEGMVATLNKTNPNLPLNAQLLQVELEGITDQDLACIKFTGDTLRKVAGLGETQSGNAAGDATATEVTTAAQGSNLRLDRIKQTWRRYLEDIYYAVAGHLATGKAVRMWIEKDVAESAGIELQEDTTGIEYVGGDMTWEEFQSLKIDIDVMSIERTSDAQNQARVMGMHQATLEAIPMMAQIPFPNWWKEEFDMLGDAANLPGQGERVRKLVAGLREMMEAGQPPPVQPTSAPQVSLGGEPKPQQQQGQMPNSPAGQNKTPGLSHASNPVGLPGVQGT